jgi:DNA-binding protein YbaB
VLAACNEAIQKSQELAAHNMSKLTGGLKIPGLF